MGWAGCGADKHRIVVAERNRKIAGIVVAGSTG
jgi:hypothetical protein